MGFSNEEATKQVLSKYREIAISDETTIIKSLGKYRGAYNDFFDKYNESYLDGYSEKVARSLANRLLSSDSNLIIPEFENEKELVEYFMDKILCFEIIHRMNGAKVATGIRKKMNTDYIIPIEILRIFYEEYNGKIWEEMSEDSFLNCFDRNTYTIEYPIFKRRMKHKFIRFLATSQFSAKEETIDNLIFRCFRIMNYKGAKYDLVARSKTLDETDRRIESLFKQKL